ncbi:MAG: hypothetical protein QOH74_1631, partial [Gaiellales bacterium]|nr:hypothetical protein [Gaiellales bacterium]
MHLSRRARVSNDDGSQSDVTKCGNHPRPGALASGVHDEPGFERLGGAVIASPQHHPTGRDLRHTEPFQHPHSG